MNQAPVQSAGMLSTIGAAFASITTVFHTINRGVRMVDSVVAAGEVHAAYLHETSLEDIADKRAARAATRAKLEIPITLASAA